MITQSSLCSNLNIAKHNKNTFAEKNIHVDGTKVGISLNINYKYFGVTFD